MCVFNWVSEAIPSVQCICPGKILCLGATYVGAWAKNTMVEDRKTT